jgi:diguanylate cyclase (GGDEF)-like protein/PAS domain S-box-containing protein
MQIEQIMVGIEVCIVLCRIVISIYNRWKVEVGRMELVLNNLNNFEDNQILNPLTISVLENITEGIILTNDEGKLIYINKKASSQLGYLPEELMGLTQMEAFALILGKFNDFEDILLSWENNRMGQSTKYRRRFTHKTGRAIPLEILSRPIHKEEGKFAGQLSILRDLHKELLVKVISLINSSLSLKDVLHNTTVAVVENLGISSNSIFALDEEKGELQLISCNVVNHEEDLAKVVFKIGEGPPGKCAVTKLPVYVKSISHEPNVPEFTRMVMGDISSINYPLNWKGQLLGVMAFDADKVRSFTEKELALFETIANQVALAMYNTKLFSSLERLSTIDELTQIYNYRHFKKSLEKEHKRAQRSHGTFGILMIDVDYFKNYNDTLGHPQGDKLLKELATKICNSVRSYDVVARYGGEEFAVILVDCNQEDALKVAEKIRKNIEKTDFYGRVKQPSGNFTVSIGLAMFNESITIEQLIEVADQALYKAKQTGRNRVEVANK